MSVDLTLAAALALDAADELKDFRERFAVPKSEGKEWHYFCGHSLGLMPHRAPIAVETMLAQWRDLAVQGHFRGPDAWLTYQEQVREPMAALMGAEVAEVVAMNSLSINLHLLMASFYRPDGRRNKIVVEKGAFPSDRYAMLSQLQWHGLDPAECLVEIEPPAGSMVHGLEGLHEYLRQRGDEVAIVLWPGVQYVTGESFDLDAVVAMSHAAGAIVGFDLAHMAGNVPVALHACGVDFASWCTYKYLNSGPGSVAGFFVHSRHHGRDDLIKLTGWWGNDVNTRFRMAPDFDPAAGAAAWQISNPPIFSLAPLVVSLAIFNEAGMDKLRDKSIRLTGYLEHLIQQRLSKDIEIITPADPQRRGCALSLRLRHHPETSKPINDALIASGVISDWRAPDVIRFAPVPLYNTFSDVWHAVERLEQELNAHR